MSQAKIAFEEGVKEAIALFKKLPISWEALVEAAERVMKAVAKKGK